jgi:hypothetical protein
MTNPFNRVKNDYFIGWLSVQMAILSFQAWNWLFLSILMGRAGIFQ